MSKQDTMNKIYRGITNYSEIIYENTDINDLPNETWKEYPLKSGFYASTLGRVKFNGGYRLWGKNKIYIKPYILSQRIVNNYLRCSLGRVSRIIAITYIENPEGKPSVNHIDGNKLNNKLENLEWMTYSEQQKHARENNLFGPITEAQRKEWHNNGVKNGKHVFNSKFVSKNNLGRRWMTNSIINKFANKEQQLELLELNFIYGMMKGGGANA